MSGISEAAVVFGGAGGGTFVLSRLFKSSLFKKEDGVTPDLKKINLALAAVHATLALASYLVLKGTETPAYINFTLNRVRVSRGSDKLNDPFVNEVQEGTSPLDAKWGLFSFYLITSFSHLWYANSPTYMQAVQRGHNPYRWFEYGVTSSIMIYLVCMLNGVRDFTALVPIIGSNIITMYCGFAMEEAILRKDFDAARQFLVIGFAALAHNFLSIDVQFFLRLRDIQSIEDPETGEKVYKIPPWLYIVVLPTVINFGLFGLAAYRWYSKAKVMTETTGTMPSYLDTEMFYMNLSLFAKSFLGLGIMTGYRNAGRVEDILA